jgi:hypothetical protein
LETAAGTGVAATGQALMTDMTPGEIALASAAGFGAGMVGRPILGRAGQYLGTKLDKNVPAFGREMIQGFEQMKNLSGPFRPALEAKMAPYAHLGGGAQYMNMLGRGYGDNIAQAAVALAAPGIFGGEEEIQ